MSKAITNMCKWIIIVLFILISITYIKSENYLRILLMFLATILCIVVIDYYISKKKFFGIGLMFYVWICYLTFTLLPYYYDSEKLIALDQEKVEEVVIPGDHFLLYVLIFYVISAIIILYLYFNKPIKTDELRKPIILFSGTDSVSSVLLFDILFVLPFLGIIGSQSYAATAIPSFVYFFVRLFYKKGKLNILVFVGTALILIVFVFRIISARYIVIKYALPIVFILYLHFTTNSGKIKTKYVYLIIMFVFALFMLYGIISEVNKLNSNFGGNYDLFDVLFDFKNNFEFVKRQLYRVLDIWTVLGGNIIEHVEREGFYYGLSYIKSFSHVLGLPYVNLPIISAQYILASYAQPGLVAEGYANFGFFGAVINVLVVFFIIEILQNNYLKNKTLLSLILLVCPFGSIFLDGGTINDVLLNIFFVYCTFNFSLLIDKINKKKVAYSPLQKKEFNDENISSSSCV